MPALPPPHQERHAHAQPSAASPRCENCGATPDLTADHLIPVIDRGAACPLRTLCRSCNSRRGSKTLAG
ncbi:MAG: HNH endonuclease [Gaiellaceae bacterium]